ncbi:uncharacterized protein LDX57_004506 [Aspergillus melleus]|uniref:uncharacterized protein n=1 Tax=Aspergillus melleus TaxID=138277 RepID=UPI001E8D9ACA|nr:uncharacterized protein LDX57_004506 [Aspergillus melleus]KAH8426773.1 hypothetical protein LDX57_004506 [Aspergillus melleus]
MSVLEGWSYKASQFSPEEAGHLLPFIVKDRHINLQGDQMIDIRLVHLCCEVCTSMKPCDGLAFACRRMYLYRSGTQQRLRTVSTHGTVAEIAPEAAAKITVSPEAPPGDPTRGEMDRRICHLERTIRILFSRRSKTGKKEK